MCNYEKVDDQICTKNIYDKKDKRRKRLDTEIAIYPLYD